MNNGYFTRRRMYIYDNIPMNAFYNKKYFRKKLEEIKAYILRYITLFLNRAIYGITWKNMA